MMWMWLSFLGYEGVACQRTVCPDDCNGRGTCWPERILAAYAGNLNAFNVMIPTTSPIDV